MIDFSKELNKAQLNIIENGDDYCLVLAGAGSGKTRVITYRVAYLLAKKVNPNNILLLTFTNKAASEMNDRIIKLNIIDKKLPWSGTFHHIAYKILKRYSTFLGYENNFSVLDSEDSRSLIKICLKEEGIEKNEKRFPSAKIIQNIISYSKNSNSNIENIVDRFYSNFNIFIDEIKRIADNYTKRKKENNVMDFDDLLYNFYLLLVTKKEIKEKIAGQFKYILVDEYQDTNKIQSLLVDELASINKNLLVVGDDAQSIYSFRAADIENILYFEEKFKAKIFKLETNYRSTPEILNLANDVIKNNSKQYKKKLESVQEFFTRPELYAFSDNLEEAEFIVKRILELKDEGVKLNKIAVLFRAAYHSQVLEMELTKRNINYDFRGGLRFFERAHVKDVLTFLRILNNKNDNIAWQRILNMQLGIGVVSANKIITEIQNTGKIDYEKIKQFLSSKAQLGWSNFWQIFKKIKDLDKKNPEIFIKNILTSKYKEYLESEYSDFRERIEDIKQLIIFARKYDDLSLFLAEATLQEGFNRKQAISGKKEDKIVLTTIHQAKGLEWDAVFIIGLAQGMFPSERVKSSSELEEERRLFYVSITRAKKYLYLTYPLSSKSYMSLSGPSLFLQELKLDLVENNSDLDTVSTSFFDPSDDEDDIKYINENKPVRSFLKSIDEL